MSAWKLVPVEPVESMLATFHDSVRIMVDLDEKTASIMNDRHVWSAMLSASPDPAADEALVERVAEAIYGGDWNSLPDEAWLPNHGPLQDGKAEYRFMALAAIRAMEEKP